MSRPSPRRPPWSWPSWSWPSWRWPSWRLPCRRRPSWRGPRSLRERLALVAVLVTAAWLALLTVGFNVVLARQLRSDADTLLRTRAYAAAASLVVAPDGRVTRREPPPEPGLDAGTWLYAGSRALQRPPASGDQQRQADALAGVGERTAQTREPEAVRFYALPVRAGQRQVATVVTSVGLDPYRRVEELALAASTGLAALVLGGAYLITRTLVGRALGPVAQMTEQARRWSASDLGRRFGAGRRPTELEALAATLDGLLERLAAVLRHEQQLSAELSHELRTPLAAVTAEVDLLRRRPRAPDELARGHAAIADAAERMSHVLESLLTAARASTSAPPGRCEVVPAVHAAIASVAPSEGAVQVHAPAGPVYAGVDDALLERALAPVLDNALRHRRTHVRVDVADGPAGPRVSVQDDGPGVPEHLREQVFEPGVRGADGGSGLGLALARRLARAGGGDLHLEQQPPARRPHDSPPAPALDGEARHPQGGGCGARFVLTLPAG